VNLRKVAIVLIALQCIGISQSNAATTKPEPKVSTAKKITVPSKSKTLAPKKKTALATAKKVVTPKKKATTPAKKKVVTPKKTAISPTKKQAVVVKKKVSSRKYVAPKAIPRSIPASPKPKWPPVGFTSIGSAYARVPTGQELIGILSAKKDPTVAINSCALDPKKPDAPAFACAAILVGATEKCTWWRISTTLTGNDPEDTTARVNLGDLTTYARGAAAKTIQTIFLVSPVPLHTGIMFTAIHALCGIGPSTDAVPGTTFEPAPGSTPSETPTPLPSPTNS
jgi:hypothetical protein